MSVYKNSVFYFDSCKLYELFYIYINDVYNIYNDCIPLYNDKNKVRAKLIDMFDHSNMQLSLIDNIKYMQYFSLSDGVVWLKNIFKGLNIKLSIKINSNNLSEYINDDLFNFTIHVYDIDNKCDAYIHGKIIMYLMNIDVVASDAISEVKHYVGFINACATSKKYNAFIFLNE